MSSLQQHSGFPLLTTERLLLRQLQPADNKAIFALRSNEQVNTFIQRPLANSLTDALHFIEAINEGIASKDWLYWGLVLKANNQLAGTICLWHFSPDGAMAEIGYELHPDFQGKGLMNEAMQTVIDYAFTVLHLQAIEAYTQPKNLRSIKILEKNGFAVELANDDTGDTKEIRFVLQKPVG